MMGGQLLFVYLTENRRLMIDGLGLAAKQARRQAGNFAGEGEFGAGHQTHRGAEVVDIGEAASSGTEIPGHKLVAHFRGPRPHALEAKVTHWRTPVARLNREAFNAPQPFNDILQRLCRA